MSQMRVIFFFSLFFPVSTFHSFFFACFKNNLHFFTSIFFFFDFVVVHFRSSNHTIFCAIYTEWLTSTWQFAGSKIAWIFKTRRPQTLYSQQNHHTPPPFPQVFTQKGTLHKSLMRKWLLHSPPLPAAGVALTAVASATTVVAPATSGVPATAVAGTPTTAVVVAAAATAVVVAV